MTHRIGLLPLIACMVFATACSSSSASQTDRDSGSTGGASDNPDASTGHDARAPGDSGADTGAHPDAQPPAESGAPDAGSGPTIGGCPMFPPSYAYNQDISQAPLDPNSATYIANLASRAGAIVAEYPGIEYVNVVPASQPDVPIGTSDEFGFDTTDTFYDHSGNAASGATAPVPANAVYENSGTPNEDHHLIVVQQGTCRLFEFYSWNPSSAISGWSAMVTWNLTKDEQLPDGYGSTTAAGTPLLPGVIWHSELAAGAIHHAVDIVIPGAALAQYEYVKPAARSGGACGSNYPADGFPYGGRLRLKASFDASGFTGTEARIVIQALKTYGMIVTDDSGESRSSFRLGDGTKLSQSDMSQLSKLTWNDFEVPKMTVVNSKACN
jgi:hypothetical protein